MGEPFVVRPGDGRVLDLGTFEAVVLAGAADTDGAFSLLQTRHEPPGAFVYVPRVAAHTFTVAGEAPGTKLNLFTPAAMQGFFEELAAAGAAGVVSPQDLDAIAGRHHMEVVGPVPDTYL